MKNSVSKYMMIAAAAVALFAGIEAQAAPGGTTTTTPTPVIEQEKAARTAVEFSYACAGSNTQCTSSFTFDPAYRLVIETITGHLADASAAPAWFWFHRTVNGQASMGGYTPFVEEKTVPLGNLFMHSFRVVGHIYADSLGTITLSRLNTGGANFVITGYLVKK